MEQVVTRDAIRQQIERYQAGDLTGPSLAAWAFKQFADEEEELLVYEPGYEEMIGEVLDDLMWADATPFALDAAAAQALVERLRGIEREAATNNEDPPASTHERYRAWR
jgi:hypothetical protein